MNPLESVVGTFKNSLANTADKELLALRRPNVTTALYKLIQTEIRYGVDEGVPYSILGFRLETGQDTKKCTAVKLMGEFVQSGSYGDVEIKELRSVPEETRNSLTKIPVQNTTTNSSQVAAGIAAGNPTFQATLSHMSSVQATFTLGQTSRSGFDGSKATFHITLGVDRPVDKHLSVVDPAQFALLLRLKENRQPMKLKVTLAVTYHRKYRFTDNVISESREEDYSGNEFYDIVKAKPQDQAKKEPQDQRERLVDEEKKADEISSFAGAKITGSVGGDHATARHIGPLPVGFEQSRPANVSSFQGATIGGSVGGIHRTGVTISETDPPKKKYQNQQELQEPEN